MLITHCLQSENRIIRDLISFSKLKFAKIGQLPFIYKNPIIIKNHLIYSGRESMKKSKIPIIILISVIILIFTVSMLLSGCGRRVRIARALQEKEPESIEEKITEEDNLSRFERRY